MKKLDNKKKKLIIILSGILILIVVFVILTLVFFTVYNKNSEFSEKNVNILYYSESENQEEQEGKENVLVVGIEKEEEPTEESEKNEEGNKNIEEKKEEKKEVNAPYYIKINNQANVVTIYKKDKKGKYTVPIKAMICSIGTATPETGIYTMSDKYTWRYLQGDVYGQYACRITGHILFHSVPYQSEDKSTLEWWEYDKLGTKASLGCIRLTVQDAKWIYDNCIAGTKVEFYSSSNPGPLGKPTAKKISGDESVRNWDPTDPDKNNPWKNYKKEEEKKPIQTPTQAPTEKKEQNVNTVKAPNKNTQNNNTTKVENKINTNTTVNTNVVKEQNNQVKNKQ